MITAGIHGNELASILVARELKSWVECEEIKRVEVIPEVNKRAVELKRINNPEDNKNLNRLFLGNPNGSISEKIAYKIFKKAKRFDYLIDLHTYGHKRRCVPHILTDIDKKYNREFARKLGLEYVVMTSGTKGQLFIELSKIEIPSVLIEMGGAERIREEEIKKVKSSIKRFLRDENENEAKFFEKYEKLRPKIKGKFKPIKKPSEEVKKGEIVGYLDNKPVKSNFKGFVLGILKPGEYDPQNDYVMSIAKK